MPKTGAFQDTRRRFTECLCQRQEGWAYRRPYRLWRNSCHWFEERLYQWRLVKRYHWGILPIAGSDGIEGKNVIGVFRLTEFTCQQLCETPPLIVAPVEFVTKAFELFHVLWRAAPSLCRDNPL